MVEGLTTSASDPGSGVDWKSGYRIPPNNMSKSRSRDFSAPALERSSAWTQPITIQQQDPGDASGEAIPVPIPNTEVKLSSAEDTERAAFRENRSSPGFLRFRGFARSRIQGPSDGRRPVAGRLAAMTDPIGAVDASEQRPGTAHDPPVAPGPAARPDMSAREAVGATCPYLMSSGGAWRAADPSRDHRCGAMDPPTPQPTDKQRKHCLSADHVQCPTFRAARAARTATLAAGSDPALVDAADRRRRPLARTAPILLERPRLVDQVVRLQLDRAPGQLALIGLMVVAFAVVALTRLSSGGGPAASSAEPSSAAVVATPTSRPTPRAPPTPPPPTALAANPSPALPP